MTGRGLRRHLDDLLAGRRPRPFRATPAEADELRVAIELRAARPGADEPREGFVDELHARLAAELGAAEVDSAADASPGCRPRSRAHAGRRGFRAAPVARAPAAARAGRGSRRRLRRGGRRGRPRADRPRRGSGRLPHDHADRRGLADRRRHRRAARGRRPGLRPRRRRRVRAPGRRRRARRVGVVHPSGLPARPRRGRQPRLPVPHHRLRAVRRPDPPPAAGRAPAAADVRDPGGRRRRAGVRASAARLADADRRPAELSRRAGGVSEGGPMSHRAPRRAGFSWAADRSEGVR